MSLNTKLNLHTLQNKNSSYIEDTFDEKFRLLEEHSLESPYKPSEPEDEITTVHYGRRQLLINEIEFLCLVLNDLKYDYKNDLKNLADKKLVIIYAGAACGNHLLVLAELFPFIKFILIDDEEFDFKYGSKKFRKNLFIKNQLIDGLLASELALIYKDEEGWIRLFISDIRKKTDEKSIENDMNLQQEVHNILKPYKSYLKFRLPYVDSRNKNNGKNVRTYLDGDIYFLIWGRSHSTETRLVVHKDSGTKTYDYDKHENQLYHFNLNQRTSCYKHDVNADGFDHCYDCRAELYVLEKYLNSFDLIKFLSNPNDLFNCPKNLGEFANYISRSIESRKRKIKLCLTIDNRFYNRSYFFTDFKFGKMIETENDLNQLTGNKFYEKRQYGRNYYNNTNNADKDLIKRFNNWSLND